MSTTYAPAPPAPPYAAPRARFNGWIVATAIAAVIALGLGGLLLVQSGSIARTEDRLAAATADAHQAHSKLTATSESLKDTQGQLSEAQAEARACSTAAAALKSAGKEMSVVITSLIRASNRFDFLYSSGIQTLIRSNVRVETLQEAARAAKACEAGGSVAL